MSVPLALTAVPLAVALMLVVVGVTVVVKVASDPRTLSVVPPEKETAEDVITNVISKAPLSKYEITPLNSYQDELDVDQQWFCYSITNSYSFMRNVAYGDPCVRVLSPIKVDLNEKDYE